MLISQLITNHYPTVEPEDKVSLALQLMDDFDIIHLPIVEDKKFIGLVCKDDLLDVEEDGVLQYLRNDFIIRSVKSTEHFLSALKLASTNQLSLVPVVNDEMEWVGAITCQELLKTATQFTGAEEIGAIIVLEMERKSYSFGEISRLVETNDAHITQFNTYTETETGLLVVTIKINKQEVSDIIATFQRYEYSIRYFIGEEHYENELRYNYNHLMSYLKI
ncbi:CBS domain-containing protein [Aridibaculum aurantiacum]|uniref:CBS domain-containing protein n=1 Tax=Aridibaculum aurantiacum TaxID=2810307 RepID=UPI001A97616E|nr:CBS domain-containing protein [Aridibaculum aurantiacum]